MKIEYDKQVDALYIRIQEKHLARTREVSDGVHLDFDDQGLSPGFVRRYALPGALAYRYYFRSEVFDIERVPAGRVLLVANHAGQQPFDGLMLTMAMLLDAEPPRIARGMAEYWVSESAPTHIFNVTK